MFSALYNMIIVPLNTLLEFFYQFIFEATGNPGVAVIGLSFVVTLCTLPLYMVAEGWQEKERETQLRLKPGVARIKKFFKGDEQYMILNAFYRQNHYSPIMALRSSFSLLIQVPFFLAAYHFLSDLGTLRGVSFLFIKDFGAPDASFHIGNFAINVLPVAMTLINCCSGFIYSKGHPLQEKIQIYAFAAIFLVVLYNSPAGLVVYWTMNNILSLVKNIFYKLKNPRRVLFNILCIFAAFCLLSPFTVLRSSKAGFKKVIFVLGAVLPLLPFAVKKLAELTDRSFKILEKNSVLRCSLFVLSAAALALLSGLAIPSIIMESEPNNYCYVDSYSSPFVFLNTTFFQALGFFVLWPVCFYALFGLRIKKALSVLFTAGAFLAVTNTFAFGGHYGPVEPWLEFMQPQVFTPPVPQIALNLAVLCAVFAALLFMAGKFPKIVRSLTAILVLSLGAVSIRNVNSIQKAYKNLAVPSYNSELDPIFYLSKTEKNVLVLMQDRLFNPYLPYIFEELPELRQKFDGFVNYPNTVSMGKLTMIGTPGLFGGYDYTPYRMNRRAEEEPEKTLQDKHNEAMLTLPLIFTASGYRAQVANLPYENYLEQPESNMYLKNPDLERHGIRLESFSNPEENPYTVKYAGHEEIQHNRVLGTYTNYWYARHEMEKEPYISSMIFRNFIWFSFFKMVPPVVRGGVYHRKYWLSYNKWDNSARFVDNYAVIDYLPELTKIDSGKGSLILLDNEATHEPTALQAPEYDFRKSKDITDRGNSPLKDEDAFSTSCGIFNRLSEFFDYMKENGVYDNTRIIIVSDHGSSSKGAKSDLPKPKNLKVNPENFVASLLVKDFNARGEIRDDMTFMTNADTPYLAVKDLIDDALHPFTGKPLKVENKNDYTILNTAPAQSTRIRKEKAFTVKDREWFTVKDDIYKEENWGQLKR